MRRLLLVVVALGVVSGFAYWHLAFWSAPVEIGATETTARTDLPPKTDLSESKKRLLPPALHSGQVFHDPVVLGPCTLAPIAEQDVSSQIDGVFDVVQAELGQSVRTGQILGRLDDRQVRPAVDLLRIKAASKAAERIAKALYDEAEAKVKYAHEANRSGLQAVSDLEIKNYLAQRDRYAQEIIKAREEQQTAAFELEKAERYLALHEIKSALEGVVIKVYKRNGEAVKQGEPLFRVAAYHRLRVEGLCKAALASQLRIGMPALVEPALRGEPVTLLAGHTAAINSLAIAGDGRLLASGSADKSVLLWRWPEGILHTRLPHPGEVHAVAFAPLDVGGYRLLTACSDAMARLWRITASGAVENVVVLPRVHDGAILAVAFSGDGRWCATAGEDRRIALWDVAAGKFLYWVRAADGQAAHQGAVTTLHFVPDGHLVSAARDNTLRVWKLLETGAQLASVQPGRTGDVHQLGVTPDGQGVLFDHGEELWLLQRDSGSLAGRIQSRQQGHFQGVSVFSPSGKLLLTTSSNGRIQLWKAPATPESAALLRHGYTQGFYRNSLNLLGALAAPGLAPALVGLQGAGGTPRLWSLDAAELRYFLTPNATVACAAFAPGETIVFTAGSDKVIRAWPVPPLAQYGVPLEAYVTFLGSQVERGTDMVRIRAELDNPADPGRQLMPGMFATLRLYPETAAKH